MYSPSMRKLTLSMKKTHSTISTENQGRDMQDNLMICGKFKEKGTFK